MSEVPKLEPRHIAPAGSYARKDGKLSVKIYQKCNPDYMDIDFDDAWEKEVLVDSINHRCNPDYISDQSCYDGAGFAIITKFAPEQKKGFHSLINIGVWSGVMPKKTVIKVYENSASQEPLGDSTWCLYETLGVVNFEAELWLDYLRDKTDANLTRYKRIHAPEIVID